MLNETNPLVQPESTESKRDVIDRRVLWKSCCLVLDKRALLFFSQLFISGLIISFTIGMLLTNQDCDTFSRYSPLLTLIIGVWLPQPQLRDL
jgi:hypothetical protein